MLRGFVTVKNLSHLLDARIFNSMIHVSRSTLAVGAGTELSRTEWDSEVSERWPLMRFNDVSHAMKEKRKELLGA
jgi:hypothetical protein